MPKFSQTVYPSAQILNSAQFFLILNFFKKFLITFSLQVSPGQLPQNIVQQRIPQTLQIIFGMLLKPQMRSNGTVFGRAYYPCHNFSGFQGVSLVRGCQAEIYQVYGMAVVFVTQQDVIRLDVTVDVITVVYLS